MQDIAIKGVFKTSLLDYPGKISTVIFLGNCNFRCPFCHNPELVLKPESLPSIPPEEILDYLKEKRKWLDGLVVGGGEPTLHAGLPDFLAQVKAAGFLVKLDTNGTNPEMIKELLDRKIVDYVAMDIKAPLEKYGLLTGVKVDLEKIKQSVELLKNSNIDYEFRTTVVPGLHEEDDFPKIGQWLKGSKKYFLQQFANDHALVDDQLQKVQPFRPSKLEKIAENLKEFFEIVEIRGI
jgi:pyruvate formate lyase activating enzyme